MTSRTRKIICAMFVVSIALVIIGIVWAITQGVRAADYGTATATVTACEKQDSDDGDITARVLVTYETNGTVYENVTYIGDLNRCYVGLKMRVYYLKSAPSEYVYSKSSDLGFALILLGGGALWLAITIVYAVAVRRTGH